MSHRPLVFLSGLTVGDYLLWNWSLNGNHDVLALISGLTAASSGEVLVQGKPVQGIGDKAFEYTATSSSGGGIAIFVFKANVVLMIALSPTTDSAKVEALARAAVGRF